MTNGERKAFQLGVAMASVGNLPFSKIVDDTGGSCIVNATFYDDYDVVLTFSDGSVINITDIDFDDDGKITAIYSEYGEKKYCVECSYDSDYLRTVGDVVISDIEQLGIETTINTQDKTITPSAETQQVTADEDYDALGTVEVSGDENLVAENIKKGVSIFGVEGTASGGGGTAASITSLEFTSEDYTATTTDVDGNTADIVPTMDDDGAVQTVNVGGQDVVVEYDDNGIITKVGEVDISGIDLLSMFASGVIGGGTEMMEQTVLWEGDQTSSGSITFSESLWNYDLLIFACSQQIGTDAVLQYISIPTVLKESRAQEFMQYSTRYGSIRNISDDGLSAEIAAEGVQDSCSSYLKKVIGLKFTSRINYSTEEQCIGTWIDGKPLYQKTVEFEGTYTGIVNLSSTLENASNIMIVDGYAIKEGTYITMPYVHSDTKNLAGCFVSSDGTSFELRIGSGTTLTKVCVTFRYTKTT